MYSVVLVIHIILAAVLTILVLLQRSEGGALGAMGGGSGASLFTGRQAGNFLTRMTAYMFAAFVCTSLILVVLAKRMTVVESPSILPTTETSQPVQK